MIIEFKFINVISKCPVNYINYCHSICDKKFAKNCWIIFI